MQNGVKGMIKNIGATACVALLAGTINSHAANFIEAGSEGIAATPETLTLRMIRIGYGINPPGSNGNQPRDRVVFADSKRQILYTSDKDSYGTSTCYNTCTETWKPAIVTDGVIPEGHWSILMRDDDTLQWVFRGQPLYTYVPENRSKEEKKKAREAAEKVVKEAKEKAELSGNDVSNDDAVKKAEEKLRTERALATARGAGQGQGHEVDGRQVVELLPEQWIKVPNGIIIQEVRTAPGQIFTNDIGLPLYTFSGESEEPSILNNWTPFESSQLALPVGEFSVIARPDGIYQWAFQGHSLYTYKGDNDYGDSSGKDVDPRFKLVYALRYFMPENIQIAKNQIYGGLLTLKGGTILYVRESSSGGSDGALRGDRGKDTIGQRIGINGCNTDCEKTWRPLIASANAKPNGYWTLYNRDDGDKQWAYFGYALYSYAGEIKNLGSTEIYDPVLHYEQPIDGSTNGKFPLHWRVAPP
ncbi:MAG TPA: hypothetical protein DGZ24_07300 [Rhodospirillaceae bacterium]|nr:hypothetical protein [Rhodospirillaceae bacterium]